MLFKTPDIILPETLRLLERLQQDAVLEDFFLVGGTDLALQIGHRLSVDLDLFTLEAFDNQDLQTYLTSHYGFFIDNISTYTISGVIKGIKVDFIRHAYPLVRPLFVTDSLRLASLEDIAAMKLNAIAHSGQRLKDFVDIYFLLEKMPLSTMLVAYEVKYANSNALIPLKALTFFDDINDQLDPPQMVRAVSLEQLRKRLVESVLKPDKTF